MTPQGSGNLTFSVGQEPVTTSGVDCFGHVRHDPSVWGGAFEQSFHSIVLLFPNVFKSLRERVNLKHTTV